MGHASIIDDVRHRQSKAFKQRLNYWLKKNLPYEEALRRAEIRDLILEPLKLVDRPLADQIPMNQQAESLDSRKPACRTAESLTDDQNSRGMKTCLSDENLSAPVSEPTDAEIKQEVERLKRLGVMAEIPTGHQLISNGHLFQVPKTYSAEEQISWVSNGGLKFSSASEKPKSAIFPDQNHSISIPSNTDTRSIFDSIEVVVCLTIVSGASWLLISSSVEVLGSSPTGWLKAVLIELSILGLSLYDSKNLLLQWGSRLAALAMVALSILVLHTGVQQSKVHELSLNAASNESLSLYREDRSRLLSAYDSLPENHTTKRTALMAEVQKLTQKIESEKKQSRGTPEAKVIEDLHSVESLMRFALIFLNIVFFHRLKGFCKARPGELQCTA